MKTYTLKVVDDEESKTFKVESTNDGFTALELLGIFEFKRNDVTRQIIGEIKPDKVKRNFVSDKS